MCGTTGLGTASVRSQPAHATPAAGRSTSPEAAAAAALAVPCAGRVDICEAEPACPDYRK